MKELIIHTYEIPVRVFDGEKEKGLPAKIIQDAISVEDAIQSFQHNFKDNHPIVKIDSNKPILEIPPCPLASKYKQRPMHCGYDPKNPQLSKDLRDGKIHLNCPFLNNPNNRRCAINSAHWLVARYDLPKKTIKVNGQKFSLIRCYAGK